MNRTQIAIGCDEGLPGAKIVCEHVRRRCVLPFCQTARIDIEVHAGVDKYRRGVGGERLRSQIRSINVGFKCVLLDNVSEVPVDGRIRSLRLRKDGAMYLPNAVKGKPFALCVIS
jgi:hypothetical protein